MEVLVEDLVVVHQDNRIDYVAFELMATSPSYFVAGSFMHWSRPSCDVHLVAEKRKINKRKLQIIFSWFATSKQKKSREVFDTTICRINLTKNPWAKKVSSLILEATVVNKRFDMFLNPFSEERSGKKKIKQQDSWEQ